MLISIVFIISALLIENKKTLYDYIFKFSVILDTKIIENVEKNVSKPSDQSIGNILPKSAIFDDEN